MHYLFVDESYREEPNRRAILVASWAVEQGRLNRNVQRLNEFFKPPILARINSTLEDLDGLALVANATLEKSLFRTGEVDGTDDIPAMARADNIWSVSVTHAIASLILELLHCGHDVGTLDVHFDPKSLKPEHAAAWEGFLRRTVVSEARRFAAQLAVNRLKDLRIRRVQPVPKPERDRAADKFQIGTQVAHKLCSAWGRLIAESPMPRIKTVDMSEVVRRTVQQMDGKSYYEK